LRALLPSIEELPQLTWNHAFEYCVLEKQSPYLLNFKVRLARHDIVLSEQVLEAAPALVRLELTSAFEDRAVLG